MRMPVEVIWNSRIVRSWLLSRFLTTDMACLISPCASKYRSRITLSARWLTSTGDCIGASTPCCVIVAPQLPAKPRRPVEESLAAFFEDEACHCLTLLQAGKCVLHHER